MDLVCPLCNGIYKIDVVCPYCNGKMTDQGAVVNFLDEYSPYLLDDVTHMVDNVSYNKCVHLYKCTKCNKDKRVEVDKIMI